ncbi:TolC family protein [Dyadobacter arcticus]|uniref:Outer membrane protein TolC n=1 Tax=Dyadobacter arcticus TaxID=1078754 RepID=A0ABX0UH99_9BACT|nr:TolC family protein [Dyadobacter arcticus]NIJ52287.1 outer membrane protein TolC [Dyadobacter arcticus]
MYRPVTLVLNLIAICLSTIGQAQQFSMKQCLEYAELHNPELLLQGSRLSTAELESKAVKSRFLPKLEGSAALYHYWQIPVQVFPGQLLGQPEGSYVPVRLGTPWTGSYGVDATFDLLDASSWQQLRLKALQKQLVGSEWSSLKGELFKNVQMAFWTAQLSRMNVASTTQQYLDYQESHRLISAQFEKGVTDKITVNQSANIMRNLNETVNKAESDFRLALLDLKFWMRYPMSDSILIDRSESFSFGDTVSGPFDPKLLPDDEAYLLKTEIVGRQYSLARSEWYPKLSLISGYSRLGFGQKFDFISNSGWFSSGFVGLKLNIPILDLNKMVFEPKRQKMMMKTTQLERLQYQQEQRRVWLREEILLKEAINSVAVQEENLDSARENQQLSEKKLKNGIISVIELKQLQDELSQVQGKLNSAKLEYLKHYIELHHLQNNQQ